MRESLAKSVARQPGAQAATSSSTPTDYGRAYRDPVLPATPAPPTPVRAEEALGPVEEIAQAYLATTQGDAGIALRVAITDALSDLLEAERRARENSRLISRGYVRDAMRR